ncbi:hypothetical protein DL546_003097 [Coniochaeta pulveracea]|uniref:Phospholipase/carboxylesterase/thioesterase domain-containing protein n=1 Tax=Coniochaeta pulveracea TaxID=177199 RepID=A0A420XZ76_9PEZI|nr:hypothetical protein DL546_003097 [Coniochaeta pulveracea]
MPVHIVGPAEGHRHSHTVILLHGRDSEAEEFASEFFESEVTGTGTQDDRTLLAQFPTIRWVFPQAKRLLSKRFDTEMSQWFDMWSVEEPQDRPEIQIPGLWSGVATVTRILEDEEQLVSRDHIFLGGISQGFATALATFLADGRGGFAGLCGFSSWLPLANAVQEALNEAGSTANGLTAVHELYRGRIHDSAPPLPMSFTTTPILLQHCRDDHVISINNVA